MSKKKFIHYRKLEDLSDIGINSTKDNNIFNSSKEESKKDLTLSTELDINTERNNSNPNITTNENITENSKKTNEITESMYDQLILAKRKIQFLSQENYTLKQVIVNKDLIISEYEETLKETAEKMIKLQKINEQLNNELNLMSLNNSMFQNENININNNQYLLDSLKDIKNNIGLIENNYNQKLIEREELINQLNYDLQINNDYKKKINSYLNSIYDENNYLNTQICCLLKEKEILLAEKEKEHNEIIRLNELLNNKPDEKRNFITNEIKKEYEEKEIKLENMLKKQEKEFVQQISNLHRCIIEREKEIDNIKEKYQDTVMKLNLEIEDLKLKLDSFKNL